MGCYCPPVGSTGKAPGGGQAAKSPEAEGIMIAEKTLCAISEQFFLAISAIKCLQLQGALPPWPLLVNFNTCNNSIMLSSYHK